MNNCKYGIIMYKDTCNLGDDIQTYAALQFYPKVDYIIDREKLSYFVPIKKEKIKVIVNGWYNHDRTNSLISPYIDPLFESIHFSENDLILSRGYTYLTDYAKVIMSKYKIGCRDKTTYNTLKSLGYKNIKFSSCLTTTLNPIEEKHEEEYIVAVDLNPKIVKHLKKISKMKVVETTHWLIGDHNLKYRERLKVIEKYNEASTEEKNKMVEWHSKLSFNERMKIVEEQLKLYQNAKLVITDRIHVGLPCLGLNTNVLLIYYDYNADRVETFKEFLSNCTEEEFLQMTREDLFKIKNNKKYVRYRNELIKNTNAFFEKNIDNSYLPDVNFYKEHIIPREEYIKKLYMEKINELQIKGKRLAKDSAAYNKIKSSRSWKIIGKYYED